MKSNIPFFSLFFERIVLISYLAIYFNYYVDRATIITLDPNRRFCLLFYFGSTIYSFFFLSKDIFQLNFLEK